jgi:hypothetical protein
MNKTDFKLARKEVREIDFQIARLSEKLGQKLSLVDRAHMEAAIDYYLNRRRIIESDEVFSRKTGV